MGRGIVINSRFKAVNGDLLNCPTSAQNGKLYKWENFIIGMLTPSQSVTG